MKAITAEKVCPICQKQFRRSHRANRFRAGRLHEEHTYCSPGCRQKAYRRRLAVGAATRRIRPRRVTQMLASAVTQKPHRGREVAATVTQPNNSIEIAEEFSTKTRGVRPPKRLLQTDDGEIIADAKWPGMYRVKWRDGVVSDMVNYIPPSGSW